MEIDRCEPGGWNDIVTRGLASETVTATAQWSAGHALRPKRVADEPSFV
jgi:hypothetical protein